jgi:nucleoside-diphosphate-sugar epimerase
MSTYLVTGGAGFIGTNLVKKLLEEGHVVRILDNFSAGKFEERIQPGAEYQVGDIRSVEDIKRAAKGVDGIFHLAALPRVLFSVENPELTHDVNVNGTMNVLLVSKELGIKRVVFATSSAAYGDQGSSVLEEDGMVKKPLSPYALHKFIGEQYCRIFFELYGVETVSLCYFNVYGPFLDPEGAYALVIGKFLKLRREGSPLTIRGDGEMYRDFTHVDDIVRGTMLAMQSQQVGHGEVINLGYGSPRSVNQLAALVGGEIVFVPALTGEMKYTCANNQKAKKLLGWEPVIVFEEGVSQLKKLYGIS